MYYIVFGFLYLLSLLPLRVLYLLSDFCWLLAYYVVGYRKAVVMENLAYAFPEKSLKERKKIASGFYRNFIDHWFENIKMITMSRRAIIKRNSGNFEVLDQLYSTGRSVQANLAHFFNWEMMALYVGISQPYPFLSVYLPQHSKIANRLMTYIRGRFGNPLISSTNMARDILPWRKKQYLLALGGDQGTPFVETAYWLYFFNRPAGFVKGPEKFAKGQNIPVVMMTCTKPKRGHYHYDFFLLAEDPGSLPDGELLRQYVKHMEANIRLQPENWLWSHRRWKRGWKPEYEKLWIDKVPSPTAGKVAT
jgi:KDO2-lipid IV(A) lauroyltransferase